MEQTDIDKLLVCRQAIDEHRVRKQEARDIHAEAVATGFVTRKSGKSGSLSTTFESVPIDEGTVYTNMQTVISDSINNYSSILADNGFASFDDFIIFNKNMCAEIFREYITISGACAVDRGCTGCVDNDYIVGDYKPNVKNMCFYGFDSTTVISAGWDWQKWMAEMAVSRGHRFVENKDGTYRMLCIEGAYAFTIKGGLENLPFDLSWK